MKRRLHMALGQLPPLRKRREALAEGMARFFLRMLPWVGEPTPQSMRQPRGFRQYQLYPNGVLVTRADRRRDAALGRSRRKLGPARLQGTTGMPLSAGLAKVSTDGGRTWWIWALHRQVTP